MIYVINWGIEVPPNKLKIEKNTRMREKQKLTPQCQLSDSINSNLLESISLTTQVYSQDHSTRSLTNSGHSMIIVSAGAGFYFGEEHLYKLAKVNSMKNNVSVFLVAFKRTQDLSSPLILLEQNLTQSIVTTSMPQNVTYKCAEAEYYRSYMDLEEEFTIVADDMDNITYMNRLGIKLEDSINNFIDSSLSISCHSGHVESPKIESAFESKLRYPRHAYWINLIFIDD
jgi:Vacuolar membrane-associated protein Iml1